MRPTLRQPIALDQGFFSPLSALACRGQPVAGPLVGNADGEGFVPCLLDR